MIRQVSFILLMTWLSLHSSAQSFIKTDSICEQTDIEFNNFETHTNANYLVNKSKLDSTFNIVKRISLPNIGITWEFKLVEFQDRYFGFLVSFNNNNLYRLDFGEDLLNTPIIVNLGNLNGALNRPVSIDIKRVNDLHHCVITNWTQEKLVFLTFDQGIDELPSVQNISLSSNFPQPITAGIIKSSEGLIVTAHSNANDEITFLDFQDGTFNNNFTQRRKPSIDTQGDDFYMTDSCIYYCNTSTTGRITLNKYSTDMGIELYSESFNGLSVQSRNCLFVPTSDNQLKIFGTNSSSVYSITFDPSSLAFSDYRLNVLTDNENVNNAIALDHIQFNNEELLFVPGNDNFIYILQHNTPKQTETYTQIEYTALDTTTDREIRLLDSVYIIPTPNPSIHAFKTCSNNNTELVDSSRIGSDIFNWVWSVNNTIINSTDNMAQFDFQDSGTYLIQVVVENICGKLDSASKNLTIVPGDDIISDFIVPDSICSFAEVTFNNSSVYTQDSIISSTWHIINSDLDTVKFSQQSDLIYRFDSTNSFEVSLKNIGNSGCMTSITKTISPKRGPQSSFNYTDSCLFNDLTIYNDIYDSTITSLSWMRNDVFISNDSSFTLISDSIETFVIRLKTSNSTGCQTEQSRTIQIFPLPDTDFDSTYACLGQGTQLLNRSSIPDNTPLNYQWYAGNQLLSLDQNPVITLDESAQPFVRLVATSVAGCQQSITKELTLVDRPRADFGYTNTCLGEPTVLSDSSVFGQAPKNWRWLIEGTSTSTQNTSFIFRAAGTYRVQLIATDALNCADTLTQTVLVNELPTAAFEVQNACIGQETVFINRTASPLDSVQKIQWSFVGLANVQTGDTARIIYNNSNTNLVELSIETQNGCKASVIESVSANPLPKSAFEVNTLLGAPPLAIQTTNTSTNADAYIWLDELAMVEETSENLAYMYEDFGVYTLQLVALTAQGCADTSSKVIRAVDPVSNIRANSISTQRVGGLVFPTLSLTNLGNYDINQLRLEVDYGGQFSTFQTLTDELPAGASKNIALNNGIESGRYSTLSYVCIRSVGENLLAPETDTSDNSACVLLSPTFEVINTFPSPATTELNIDCYLPSPGPLTVAITNAVGQELYRFEYPNLKAGARAINLDLSFLENDIYLVSLATANQKIVRKFQKVSLK